MMSLLENTSILNEDKLKHLMQAMAPLLGYMLASPFFPFISIIYVAYAGVLLSLAYIDYRERRIPNAISYPAILFAVGAAFHFPSGFSNALAGGAIAALLLLTPVLIYGPQRAGIGDVKLGLFIGLILGLTPVLFWALFIAFGLGMGVGLAGLLAGKLNRHSLLPFGPYLAAGAITGLFMLSLGG